MDKREAIIAAQQYVNTIGSKYALTRALVFGSYAKGNHHTNSDIDVAIIMKNIDNLFDMQVALLNLRNDDNLLIEPHTFREIDFDTDDPLVNEILQSGVELNVSA